MKTYHQYQQDSKQAEEALRKVQSQKSKVEQQLSGKSLTSSRKFKKIEKQEDEVRVMSLGLVLLFACLRGKKYCKFNPYVTNGLSHLYHLDYHFHFRGIWSVVSIIFNFFDENHVSKQNSPSWDAAFCSVPSGAILFAFVPLMDARLISVKCNVLLGSSKQFGSHVKFVFVRVVPLAIASAMLRV